MMMKKTEPSACERDPVVEVRIESSVKDPLSQTVTIQLAGHVAACCVNPDTAYVEFQGEGSHVRAAFEMREARQGHQFVATLKVPRFGVYSYRIVAQILNRSMNREGTYVVPANTP
jgi:hypothetical protein